MLDQEQLLSSCPRSSPLSYPFFPPLLPPPPSSPSLPLFSFSLLLSYIWTVVTFWRENMIHRFWLQFPVAVIQFHRGVEPPVVGLSTHTHTNTHTMAVLEVFITTEMRIGFPWVLFLPPTTIY